MPIFNVNMLFQLFGTFFDVFSKVLDSYEKLDACFFFFFKKGILPLLSYSDSLIFVFRLQILLLTGQEDFIMLRKVRPVGFAM